MEAKSKPPAASFTTEPSSPDVVYHRVANGALPWVPLNHVARQVLVGEDNFASKLGPEWIQRKIDHFFADPLIEGATQRELLWRPHAALSSFGPSRSENAHQSLLQRIDIQDMLRAHSLPCEDGCMLYYGLFCLFAACPHGLMHVHDGQWRPLIENSRSLT